MRWVNYNQLYFKNVFKIPLIISLEKLLNGNSKRFNFIQVMTSTTFILIPIPITIPISIPIQILYEILIPVFSLVPSSSCMLIASMPIDKMRPNRVENFDKHLHSKCKTA